MTNIPLNQNLTFQILWIGRAISAFGDSFRRMTVTLWVLSLSQGSGLAIAAITAAELLPTLILSPFAGVLVDKSDKKKLMILADIARGLISLGQILVVLNNKPYLMLILIALASCFSTLSEPSRSAILPAIVPKDDLQRANGIMVVSLQASFVVGPALGAALYYSLGPIITFSIDALTFFISALSLLFITIPKITNTESKEKVQTIFKNFLDDFLAGVRYLLNNKLIITLSLITIVQFAIAGLNSNAMIFFISKTLGRNPADIAWLSATNGIIQMLIGSYIIMIAKKLPMQKTFLISLSAMAIGGMIVCSSPTLIILIVGVIITSFGNAPFNIARATIEQTYIAQNFLGRVQSSLSTISTVVFLSTGSLSGILIDTTQPRLVLILSAVAAMTALVLAFLLLIPMIQTKIQEEQGFIVDK